MLAQQAGEYLVWVENDLTLRPVLAERWAPNDDGSEWTFALHEGVAFHDGTPLTAADVVATFDRITDPRRRLAGRGDASRGVLAAGRRAGARRPHRSSSARAPDQRLPVPRLVADAERDHRAGAAARPAADGAFVGSGPFRLARYAAGEGATLVAPRRPTGTRSARRS